MNSSDTLGVGRPDVFVHLELHAHAELVLEDPADERAGREGAEDGAREKNGCLRRL